MRVMIIGHADDPHVEHLESGLSELGLSSLVLRLGRDPHDYRFHIDNNSGAIELDGVEFSFSDLSSAGLGVALPFHANDPGPVRSLNEHVASRGFVEREWRASFSSFVAISEFRCSNWLIRWNSGTLQDVKLALLHYASELGIRVPPFVATNAPDKFPEFDETGLVAKAINRHQQITEGQFFNTTALTESQLETMRADSACHNVPSFIQARVHEPLEVRVYFAYGRFLAIAQHRNIESTLDIRLEEPANVQLRLTTIEPDLQTKIRCLCEAFDLNYCAFDILLASDDRPGVVLDINPAGSWYYLDTRMDGTVNSWICERIAAEIESTSND